MSAFRLTEVGFDKTEAIFLRTTMEMASEYDLAEWLWVDDRDADVILVNTDFEECTTKFKLDKPGQNNFRPILICCSSSEEKCDSYTHTLIKPITYTKITSLLQKIEADLTQSAETLASDPQQTDKQTRTPNQEKSISTANNDSTSSMQDQDHSDLHLHIDDDSDYDIYDLLMDSELDSTEADIAATPNDNPLLAANDQSERINNSHAAKTNSSNSPPFKRHLEKEKFIGLLKKHVLSKFKRTG